MTFAEAGNALDVMSCHVSSVARGLRKTIGGHVFRFATDEELEAIGFFKCYT